MSTNENSEFPLLAKVINGSTASLIGVTCVFPLDLVKTRLQSQQIGPDGKKMYKNMFDCFKKIHRQEGLSGMYRGSLVTILMVTPEKAIKLTANDFFCHKLATHDGTLTILRRMIAAGMAGAFQMMITTPMELLKIQLQNAGRVTPTAKKLNSVGKQKQITARSVVRTLFRENGFFGLYKGIGPTALRDIGFSIIYFPLFATFNEIRPRRQHDSGVAVAWWSFLSGLGSASVAALLVTPFDVIKTRVQLLRQAAGEMSCIRIPDCARIIYQSEGLIAFFNGGLCRIAVLAPLYGIAQMFYFFCVGETLLRYLRGSKNGADVS